MMEKVRKNAVLAGLIFFVISTLLPFIDSGSDSESVKMAIEPFVFPVFGESTEIVSGIAALIFLIASLGFYFFAWRNSKKAIWLFCTVYGSLFFVLLAEWGLKVQMGITEYIGSISCAADGIILCCLLFSSYETNPEKNLI